MTRFRVSCRRFLKFVICGVPALWTACAQAGEPHPRAPLSNAVRQAALANNQFAFDVFAQIGAARPAGDNLLASPFSISTALAMTYAGARGQTAEQMADALHWSGVPAETTHAGFGQWITDLNAPRAVGELAVANRLFGQQGAEFQQPFLDLVATAYGAPLEALNFMGAPEPARQHINDWVASRTNDLIPELLPAGSITAETRLVLTNAVYFNGTWKHEFDAEATSDQPFYAPGGVQSTPTMFQLGRFGHKQFAGYQMLELPYEGDDLSMVVVLPDAADGLAAVEAELTAATFASNVDGLFQRDVNVYLPKFTFRDEAMLKDSLAALGMVDAFSDSADFSGIGGGLKISDVIHKTFIDVNEQGTEAAAATGVIMVPTSLPPEPPTFRADHPFLFALRDRHTGGILFWGRLADPGALAAAVPEPSTTGLVLIGTAMLRRRRRSGVPM